MMIPPCFEIVVIVVTLLYATEKNIKQLIHITFVPLMNYQYDVYSNCGLIFTIIEIHERKDLVFQNSIYVL